MLYDCFLLPDQYKVSKRPTINRFISCANLLQTEREMVGKYISDIMLTSEECKIVKALMKREYESQADEVDIIDYSEFDEFD